MPSHQTIQKFIVQYIIDQVVIIYNRGENILTLIIAIQGLPNMYGHAYSKSMDQPGKVANPARRQLNRKNEFFPVRVRA